MSGRKMDRHRALAVLYYNYPTLTVETDPEWTDEMVILLAEQSADKRTVCEAYGLDYPPEWWMRAYFDEGLICPSCFDKRGREMGGGNARML